MTKILVEFEDQDIQHITDFMANLKGVAQGVGMECEVMTEVVDEVPEPQPEMEPKGDLPEDESLKAPEELDANPDHNPSVSEDKEAMEEDKRVE